MAYSNLSKVKLLHVKPSTLENYGAVSEETAREMALGALNEFETHFALSTTGLAGPTGGTPKKPVGTVCFSIASLKKDPISWTSLFAGQREAIIQKAISDALEHLLDYISYK